MNGRLLDAVQKAVAASGSGALDPDDLADALWLSAAVVRKSVSAPVAVPLPEGEGTSPEGTGHPTPEPETSRPPASEAPEPDPHGEQGAPQAGTDPTVFPDTPRERVADWRLPPRDRFIEPSSWVPLRSPGGTPLPHTLAMGRALRPLRRRMPSRTQTVLDPEATAHLAAERDLWLPEHRPAADRWLDLALVVDTSRSMSVWRSQIDEVRLLMERLGAFRDVRVWQVDADLPAGGSVTLRPGSGGGSPAHDVRELVDPAGLRLVLVVSDCVGAAWANGAMDAALREWGVAGPLAIIQMLPQRLWTACFPELVTARVTSPRLAAPNSALEVSCDPEDTFDPFGTGEPPLGLDEGELPVPVLELQPRWLSRWAGLVADPGRLSLHGTVMVLPDPSGSGTGQGEGRAGSGTGGPMRFPTHPGHAGARTDPAELLRRYQDFASTEALRLARCLAAAPLSLPVMRLIREAMVPGARPSVLAEVFLGGLLHQVSAPGAAEGAAGQDPDIVEYDFRPGVRELLLAGLHQRDKLEILAKVSDFVAAKLGSPNDFRAFVSVGDQAPRVLTEHLPFARVALEVLEGMGGRYAETARRLDHLLRGAPAGVTDTPRLDKSGSGAIPPSGVIGPTASDRTTEVTTESSAVSAETREGIPQHSDHDGYSSPVDDRSGRVTAQGDGVGTVDVPGRSSTLAEPTEREAPAVSQAQAERRGSRPSVFGGVPHRNPYFTGRTALLERLHGQLAAGTSRLALLPHAVHGLGGVGKTHLAIEYAWRYANEYELVWWIPAESQTTVRTSLVALAQEMGVAVKGQETDKTITAALNALRLGEPYGRWLLVYDNARVPEELEGLLPVPTGHVVITSRNPEWSDRAALLEVDVFARSESIALLQRRGARIGDDDAERLAGMLGDLPLALDQAAAWQATTATPAPELIRLLDERLLQLLGDQPSGYPASVVATWDLAFTELHQHSPGAVRLLELLAFFGSDPVAIPVLRDGRNADIPDDYRRVLGDDLLLRRAIREINRYALAKIDAAGNRIEVHRLVQSVLRDRLTSEQAQVTRDAVHRILGAANPGLPDELHSHERHGELLPHITPSEVIFGTSRSGHQAALDQIRYRYVKGFYSSCANLGRGAVETWRGTRGADDELTLIAQRHLAIAVREMGEYAEAAELNRDTLVRFREVLGADHEHTLATMLSLSRDLRLQARFEEARAHDEDSLARHLARYAEDDLETQKARNNLAIDLRMLGRGEEALTLDQQVCTKATQLMGADYPATLGFLANLGRDYTDSGRYAEAIELLNDTAARAERGLGEWHRNTVRARLNLAIVLRRSGRLAEARALAEGLYALLREQYPSGHEVLLSATVTFGNALLAVGETSRAREVLNEVFQGYRGSAFGPDHPFTQAAAVDLAVALRAAGDYRRAKDLDEQALESLRGSVGPDHPFTLVAQLNLAHDLALGHEHAQALELSGDAYTRSRRVRGEDRPETLICGINHAFDLRAHGEDDASAELLTRVLVTLHERYGEDHPAAGAAVEGRRAESDLEHWDT
jgi:tetratricopeptide (TPR) repeat protein